jgi:hypothetical protein
MPLADNPEARSPNELYCKHCADEQGNLKPRGQVAAGVAWWLKSWQEGITQEQAERRADLFMRALPAWAED